MFHTLRKLAADENGATAIEYALIASGIFFLIVTSITAVAGNLRGIFSLILAGFPF